MPRRSRPLETQRSEHWLRKAVNEHQEKLDALVKGAFNWKQSETIEWLSPIASDGYAEYYDEEFLTLLGLSSLKRPLSGFWPNWQHAYGTPLCCRPLALNTLTPTALRSARHSFHPPKRTCPPSRLCLLLLRLSPPHRFFSHPFRGLLHVFPASRSGSPPGR
jgi:hypothetical protein